MPDGGWGSELQEVGCSLLVRSSSYPRNLQHDDHPKGSGDHLLTPHQAILHCPGLDSTDHRDGGSQPCYLREKGGKKG